MALGKCRECGQQVSNEAKTCPSCGVSDPYVKKKGMGFTMKAVLALIALGVLGNILAPRTKVAVPTDTSSAKVPPEAVQSVAPPLPDVQKTVAIVPKRDEHCFDAGAAIAKVYMANFRQMAEVGVKATTLMEEGCQKNVGAEGSDCVRQCQTGFKVEARQ